MRALSSRSPGRAGATAYSKGLGLRSATLLLRGARPRIDGLERGGRPIGGGAGDGGGERARKRARENRTRGPRAEEIHGEGHARQAAPSGAGVLPPRSRRRC